MTHDHVLQQWIVRSVETDTYKKIFDIIPVRIQANLEIICKESYRTRNYYSIRLLERIWVLDKAFLLKKYLRG